MNHIELDFVLTLDHFKLYIDLDSWIILSFVNKNLLSHIYTLKDNEKIEIKRTKYLIKEYNETNETGNRLINFNFYVGPAKPSERGFYPTKLVEQQQQQRCDTDGFDSTVKSILGENIISHKVGIPSHIVLKRRLRVLVGAEKFLKKYPYIFFYPILKLLWEKLIAILIFYHPDLCV